ncbi:MAG: hypothetical protein A2854_00635 [Parcubacteria group bacterium RIFCSPHIGHO2_01_FULL_56_18]|nr:MAG: hypothetical protein A2854_00635 [Parcubacteria group bacterium RIFCSPHIGHO2_01_FULL_56_18]
MSAAFIVVVLVVGLVFGIDKVSGGLVRGYARRGGASLSAAASAATSVITENGLLSSKRALQKENIELKGAIAIRDENAARFKALEDENEKLRKMADLAATGDGVTAPVLSSFRASPYGTFMIGAGSVHGVSAGSVVLTEGGFILGVVTGISARIATVESLFAPGKEIEMNVDGNAFVAEGRGGGNARGEIARDASVAVGDAVLVPAFASRPAGVIGELQSASSSAYTTLYIRLPVNLDSLRYVYVLPL